MSCVFISITISSPGRRLTWSSEIDLDAKANLNRSDVSFSLLWMCLYNKGSQVTTQFY